MSKKTQHRVGLRRHLAVALPLRVGTGWPEDGGHVWAGRSFPRAPLTGSLRSATYLARLGPRRRSRRAGRNGDERLAGRISSEGTRAEPNQRPGGGDTSRLLVCSVCGERRTPGIDLSASLLRARCAPRPLKILRSLVPADRQVPDTGPRAPPAAVADHLH